MTVDSSVLSAIFSDETPQFRSPAEPNPGDTVKVRLRVAKDSVSRAIIVSSAGTVRSVTRHRAFELGIEVIDQNDLTDEASFCERLCAIAKWPEINV